MLTQVQWTHRLTFVAAFVLLASLCNLADASEWQVRDKTDGIKIETRETRGSDIETIRGVMDVPYGHAQVTQTIFSMKAQRQYLVGLAELKMLKQTKNNKGEPERVVYQRNAYPGVSDRDMVIRFRLEKLSGKSGPGARIIMKLMKNANRPHESSAVAMEALDGSWTIKPLGDGRGSRIAYICQSDVGGFLPDLFVNLGQVDNLKEMLTNLRMVLVSTLAQ